MKKYIAGIMCVFVLCCTGPAFGEGRDHGGGHGYYHDNHGDRHQGYYHSGWGFGFYAPAVTVVTPLYPAYYPPVPRCRYIDVYDAWGNFRGQERVCD